MATFCTNCATPLETGAKFCAVCGTNQIAPQAPTMISPSTTYVASATNGKRFPALRIIASLFKVLAVLAALGGILTALNISNMLGGPFNQGVNAAPLALIIALWGVCLGLFLWATAELIQVLLDIE